MYSLPVHLSSAFFFYLGSLYSFIVPYIRTPKKVDNDRLRTQCSSRPQP